MPLTGLDTLLARPGLAARLRLLVLVKIAARHGDAEHLGALVARARADGLPRADLEETLLQGVLFHGFPRTVSAFGVLAELWPADRPPERGSLPRARWTEAGRELFDAIYARNAAEVHAMLKGFHPDLHDFVLESAYGRVLSRPGLLPRERELLAVGALAAMDQVPQMIAHARGARHFGATREELRETLVTALGDVPAVTDHLRRIK